MCLASFEGIRDEGGGEKVVRGRAGEEREEREGRERRVGRVKEGEEERKHTT